MALNVGDGFFSGVHLFLFAKFLVIMGDVSGVENIIFDRKVMVCECFQVMGSDEPLAIASILLWHIIHDILLVVVCWQVDRIRSSDIVIDKFLLILNYSKLFFGVIWFPSFRVTVK
jgi:hypothetical protein